MDAALHGIWETPGHSSKGGENDKVDSPDHGKVRGGRGGSSEGTWNQRLQSSGAQGLCTYGGRRDTVSSTRQGQN